MYESYDYKTFHFEKNLGFMRKILLSSLRKLKKRFAKNDKAETNNLLAILISIKYKEKGNIREYIKKMSNIAFKLKALKLGLSDDLIVHSILYLSYCTIQSIYSELQYS